MIQALKLLLPALIPSWNFFDVIGDSPRVEYRVQSTPDDTAAEWRAFRPRPQHLSPAVLLGRLIWNARWNETLFVMGCADRLADDPAPRLQNEIFCRIAADIFDAGEDTGAAWLQFRILLISLSEAQDETTVRQVAFTSAPRRLTDINIR